MIQAQGVVVALDHQRVAFELPDDGSGVDVIDAEQPAPLRDHAERDAMVLLARVGPVAGAVQVQDHAVAPRPLRHRLHRREADCEVHHDDHAAKLLRELGALVHLLHRCGGHVHVMTLDLSALRRRPVDALDRVQEPVTPAHEWL